MTNKLFQSSVLSDQIIFATSRSNRDLGRSARLHTRWTNSAVAIVSIVGDVDSTNAGDLAEYVLSDLAPCRALILDMTRLEFLGAAGFSALKRISLNCNGAGMSWALVPGDTTSRLLRICDPEGTLPAVGTVSAALATLVGRNPIHATDDCDGICDIGDLG